MESYSLSSLDIILVVLVFSLIFLGFLERIALNRSLSRIPIRVHVNGVRGKSSVTRLIAAGLRSGGIKTVAKTTGTYPRLILEDGSEITVKRRGKANIKEQIKTIYFADKRGAQAIVLECNAIQPEYQWISEHKIIKSTIGVITNVRRDHIDVMGETLDDIARCISNTIPKSAILFTAEKKFMPFFAEKAKLLGTRSILLEEIERNPGKEKNPILLFPENLELSAIVCEYLGIDRNTALKGMKEALPDPGALKIMELSPDKKSIRFINAFSANDPDSIDQILKQLRENNFLKGYLYGIINNRKDRIFRTLEFAKFIASRQEFEKSFIIGDSTRIAWKEALRNGADKNRLCIIHSKKPDEIIKQILESIMNTPATIIGMGNFGGSGGKILSYLENNSSQIPPPGGRGLNS